MASNIREFNGEVLRVANTLPAEQSLLLQKKIALQALIGVVNRTPVDTGRARGAWQVTLATVPDKEFRSRNPIASGTARIEAKTATFSSIFITNNVPYIIFLEGGSSKQAPRGMVAVTLEELRVQFARTGAT